MRRLRETCKKASLLLNKRKCCQIAEKETSDTRLRYLKLTPPGRQLANKSQLHLIPQNIDLVLIWRSVSIQDIG